MAFNTGNTKTLATFIACKAEIGTMLGRLAAFCADRFDVSADGAH